MREKSSPVGNRGNDYHIDIYLLYIQCLVPPGAGLESQGLTTVLSKANTQFCLYIRTNANSQSCDILKGECPELVPGRCVLHGSPLRCLAFFPPKHRSSAEGRYPGHGLHRRTELKAGEPESDHGLGQQCVEFVWISFGDSVWRSFGDSGLPK